METVCIIGGGLGGLMTGALLAKEGFRVTVLEKNTLLGGGLQTFVRGGLPFDTGMHIFGGMGPDGTMRRVCRYLGIDSRLDVEPRYDTLIEYCSGRSITFPFGRDNWVRRWVESGFASASMQGEIQRYVDQVYALTDHEPLFNLRPSNWQKTPLELSQSAPEFINSAVSDPMLCRALAYLTVFYAGRADSPALLHAMITRLHIDGTYTFRHGSIAFAKLLEEVIVSAGGEVRCGEEVLGADVEGRSLRALRTAKGRYSADRYISAVPVTTITNLIPEAFSPAFRHRMEDAPLTYSAFTLFLGLKPRTLRYGAEAFFTGTMDTDPWNAVECSQEQWPVSLFALPAVDEANPGFARSITLICPMDYGYVSPWEATLTHQRPEAYYRWKEAMAAKALRFVDTLPFNVPVSQAVASMETGTPLTVRDYYGNRRGAVYGLHTSYLNPMQTTVTTHTKLGNLLLTGQDINFHGLVGTTLTAIMTVETLLGENTIVNKL